MDNIQKDPNSKRSSSARERRKARRERRKALVTLKSEGVNKLRDIIPDETPQSLRDSALIARDALWHLVHRTPALKIGGAVLGVGIIGFVLSVLLSSNIGPNIWALGTALGGKNLEEAEAVLLETWYNDVLIEVHMEGETFAEVRPSELGITLDAAQMAADAKSAGLSGVPFGQEITPVLEADYGDAQTYMLSIVDSVYIPPYEAGYEWVDGEIIGVDGQPSRELDVSGSAQLITQRVQDIIETRRLNLLTTSRAPAVTDPAPYLAEAYEFVTGDFTLVGYDPFTDEEEPWATTQAEMAKWLAAGETGLVLRDAAFERLVDAINEQLRSEAEPRYLDESEAKDAVREAIQSDAQLADVRIRYMPNSYDLESGDWGYVISRKTGMPFRNIQDANPNTDWENLVIGQTINLPSRDLVVPEPPVREKRIVVDLERLWLVAYENDEIVYSWAVSSGQRNAPTYPGVYQILSKTEKAYGSTFDLCGANGCGQWEMNWFMGIYEVAPGLTNGFHGAVLLPNGARLNGGSVQTRSTYGCVMSDDPQAQELYNWAEVGTIVEIVSSEYPPQSDLAQQAMTHIDQVAQPTPAQIVQEVAPFSLAVAQS